MAIGESRWLFCWALCSEFEQLGKAVELRSTGQPRAAVPTFIVVGSTYFLRGENL